MRSCVVLRVSQRLPCAADCCGSRHVAASGGQGGLGGLRFPPKSSLDSPLPLETPPLRYGAVAARAGRCAAGAGSISALRRISAVVWEAAGAGRCAAGAGWIADLRRCGCAAFLPRESARGPADPLALIRVRRRVRRTRGNFFEGELAPRRRNCFLSRANGREGGLPPDQ